MNELISLDKEKLKKYTIDDLIKIQKDINEILSENKEKKESPLVIYQHDCFGSSNYHFNKYKHWAKIVNQVDKTKKGGYAIIGTFISCKKQELIEDGSIVVEVCSGDYVAYRVTNGNKERLCDGSSSRFPEFLMELEKFAL